MNEGVERERECTAKGQAGAGLGREENVSIQIIEFELTPRLKNSTNSPLRDTSSRVCARFEHSLIKFF